MGRIYDACISHVLEERASVSSKVRILSIPHHIRTNSRVRPSSLSKGSLDNAAAM
jgi:hypothetical protein